MRALFIVKLYDIRIKEQGAFTSTDCLVKIRTFSLMSTNVWGKANWTLKIQLVSLAITLIHGRAFLKRCKFNVPVFCLGNVGHFKAESILQLTNLKPLLQYLRKLDVANKSLYCCTMHNKF